MNNFLFKKDFNTQKKISVSFDVKELENIKNEFIWFFNGSNNAKFLFENDIEIYLNNLYEKYINEIDKLIKYYSLNDIISESEYIHGWFHNWKNLDLYTKDQFLNKIKYDQEFSNIWADMGITDSLELRNWGIHINFDSNDNPIIQKQGKDQIKHLITSIASDPENGFHILNFYNVSNREERLVPPNLLTIQFYCEKLSYEDRIDWFYANHYETGMEYEILLETMKKENLNKVKWYDEFIYIPEYNLNLSASYNEFINNYEFEKSTVFNYLLLKVLSNMLKMVPNKFTINALKTNIENIEITQLKSFNAEIIKESFGTLTLDKKDIKINHGRI